MAKNYVTTTGLQTNGLEGLSVVIYNFNYFSDKTPVPVTATVNQKQVSQPKELTEKKVIPKIIASDTPKRPPKRTRGSMSLESNSPSTTPPPTQANKRRRI